MKKSRSLTVALVAYALVVVLSVTAIVFALRYYSGEMEKQSYSASISTLTELYTQVNRRFGVLVEQQWDLLHMTTSFLTVPSVSDEEVYDYLSNWKAERNFTAFFFIDENGNCCEMNGSRTFVDLGHAWRSLFRDKKDVLLDVSIPSMPDMMLFAVPCDGSAYKGFSYGAIAIGFNMTAVSRELGVSAFDNNSDCFIVETNGRVVLSNEGSADLGGNLLYYLKTGSDLTTEEQTALKEDMKAGRTGTIQFAITLGGQSMSSYVFYTPVGFQDWTLFAVVDADTVNQATAAIRLANLKMTAVIFISGGTVLLGAVLLFLRKRVDDKNRKIIQQETLFRQMARYTPDIFLLFDERKKHYDYVSDNLKRVLGLEPAVAMKSTTIMQELFADPAEYEAFEKQVDSLAYGQSLYRRQQLHNIADGQRYIYDIFVVRGTADEGTYTFALHDITESENAKQQIQDALLAAEKARRAKTIFLNNMSHDIRTPMNAIIGMTGIAKAQNKSPEVDASLDKIATSSAYLLSLINDVLDLSRIESGNVTVSLKPVALDEISAQTITVIQNALVGRQLTFVTERKDSLPYCVLADELRIREILMNLLSNAVKFTNDDGTVKLVAEAMPGPDGQHIIAHYVVADTGVGMSQEFLEHIFEEFTQEANDARTHYKGTGLGMSIVKRLTDLMNGTITVESAKGVGTTFDVRIPLELTDIKAEQKETVENEEYHLPENLRVLMAEDNELNAEIAAYMLEENGIKVTVASDGVEAVRLFTENPPHTFDLILMDIMMPNMDGYEATRQIRSNPDRPDGKTIPILATTANAFAEDTEKILASGMDDHLVKPIKMEAVLQSIARHTSQNKA